jgi:hypothetical protein
VAAVWEGLYPSVALYRRILPLALAWEVNLLGALNANERRVLRGILDKLALRFKAR